MFATKTGLYGTDYLQRAFITAIGLNDNLPQDTIYTTSEETADGLIAGLSTLSAVAVGRWPTPSPGAIRTCRSSSSLLM